MTWRKEVVGSMAFIKHGNYVHLHVVFVMNVSVGAAANVMIIMAANITSVYLPYLPQ